MFIALGSEKTSGAVKRSGTELCGYNECTFPLLLTATFSSGCYKHCTPNGVTQGAVVGGLGNFNLSCHQTARVDFTYNH